MMKKRKQLYLALPGTFDPSIESKSLVPMTIDMNRFRRDYRKVKKQLKQTQVIVEATAEMMRKIKIDYIFVGCKTRLGDIIWYRNRSWLNPSVRYVYTILRKTLFNTAIKLDKQIVIVTKETLLHELLEGTDGVGN